MELALEAASGLWQDSLSWSFRQWKDGVDRGLQRLISKQGLLYNLAAAAIRFAADRIRKGVTEARQQFLRQVLVEGHQSASPVLRRAKAAGLGGAKGPKATAGRAYQLCSTQEVAHRLGTELAMIRCGWSTSASKSKAASLPPRTYLLKLQLPCQRTKLTGKSTSCLVRPK